MPARHRAKAARACYQRRCFLTVTLILGKTEGRRRGGDRMRQLDGITDSMDTS